MKQEQEYLKDLAEIRTMMERSSKFMSLSGLAGVMAGIYALAGAGAAYYWMDFNPQAISYTEGSGTVSSLPSVVMAALLVLVLAVGTAILLSVRKASKREEKAWNATSRQLITHMSVPLAAGGVLLMILFSKGMIGLIAPLSLIFYGLALYNASKFTFDDVKYLGLIQILLGLTGSWFIGYGLIIWALGFGLAHILYGIYMHLRYER